MTQHDLEDVIWWPSGTWCYRYELHEMKHLGDDYEVILYDTPEYLAFMEANE